MSVTQLDDFQVVHLFIVDSEAYERSLLVESALSCRARIDVQAAERRVVLHLEDMRVPGNKEGGLRSKQFRAYFWIITPRIAADVRHHHLHAFYLEMRYLGEHHPDFLPVDVSIDGAEGFHCRELFGQYDGTNVARVPNFIACTEIFRVLFVPITMGIG